MNILMLFKIKYTFSDLFKERDHDNKNIASFTMEEWVENTLYS